MGNFGFQKTQSSKSCRTFESQTPPKFEDNKVKIVESRSGAEIDIEGNVQSFRKTQSGKYKVRVCRKD